MSVLTLKVDEVMRTLSAESSNPFVVHDKEIDIVRFAINSGFADIVLDGQVALRVMYQRPGETEVRAQTLTYYDTDGLHNYYDWHLLSADLAEKGTLTVALCILRTDGDVEEWHTTPCQIRVLDTIHTDDSDEGDESITPTVAQRVAVLESVVQNIAGGAPIVVSSTSAMIDTTQIYVLSTDGNWYYHNGTTWVSGGTYGAVATDTTLTQSGIPADAKAAGSKILNLEQFNARNIVQNAFVGANRTHAGITFEFAENSCEVNGTATATAFTNIYANMHSLPDGIEAGEKYYACVTSSDPNLRLVLFFYDANGTLIEMKSFTSPKEFMVPLETVGLTARVEVIRNTTVNANIVYGILNELSNAMITSIIKSDVFAAKDFLNRDSDLDDITDLGAYGLANGYNYAHMPSALAQKSGSLLVFKMSDNYVLQIALGHPLNDILVFRRYKLNGTWQSWVELTNAESTIYLEPSGDSADRTAEILSLLTNAKVCRLKAGDYYVNNLEMPDGTLLIGDGDATKIHLSGTADGFAIKMGSYCAVKNLSIIGADADLTFGTSPGNRHGILWEGTYSQDHQAPYKGLITDVRISRFSGGGLTCRDTGYGTNNQIEATNLYITNCWAGINIVYWSEFHKFVNARCSSCRIGCVNNGGNNIFVNCDFSSSLEIAMLMDNESNQSPNNTHGSCVGCVFNHTQSGGQSNSGVGIKIINCPNGFIFNACQIFFSKIQLVSSSGVVFSNNNFGNTNCDIEISGGKAIIFSGNIFQNTPPITVSGDAEVHFVNCYNRTTGALITP